MLLDVNEVDMEPTGMEDDVNERYIVRSKGTYA
jgi:hypothetical protein